MGVGHGHVVDGTIGVLVAVRGGPLERRGVRGRAARGVIDGRGQVIGRNARRGDRVVRRGRPRRAAGGRVRRRVGTESLGESGQHAAVVVGLRLLLFGRRRRRVGHSCAVPGNDCTEKTK